MESRRIQYCTTLWFFYFCISATTLFLQCDARKCAEKLKTQHQKVPVRSYNIGVVEKEHHLINNIGHPLELSSPLSLPPSDSLSPRNSPPFCVYPPFSPPTHAKPPTTNSPVPPGPTTPHFGPSPPKPNPPKSSRSPPTYPPPPKSTPSLPTHQPPPPPPPPLGLPPPPDHKRPKFAVWCVAKPTVPDSIMQEALDYACGSWADCKSIQPNGPCYKPNTLLGHASYAFNSYFQKRKHTGGTCDFGGTAMLVTDDPSYNGCLYINN